MAPDCLWVSRRIFCEGWYPQRRIFPVSLRFCLFATCWNRARFRFTLNGRIILGAMTLCLALRTFWGIFSITEFFSRSIKLLAIWWLQDFSEYRIIFNGWYTWSRYFCLFRNFCLPSDIHRPISSPICRTSSAGCACPINPHFTIVLALLLVSSKLAIPALRVDRSICVAIFGRGLFGSGLNIPLKFPVGHRFPITRILFWKFIDFRRLVSRRMVQRWRMYDPSCEKFPNRTLFTGGTERRDISKPR